MTNWDILFRILTALLVGGIVGVQREWHNNAAGFRTHILVSLGACLAMLTNEFLYHKFVGTTNIDIARMASYVISGIGFLGAGAIIKDGFKVRGLTTAAGLWVVACLGIAAGAGFYFAVLICSVLVIGVIALLKLVEDKYIHKKSRIEFSLSIKNVPGQLAKCLQVISALGVLIKDVNMDSNDSKWIDVVIRTTVVQGLNIEDITVKLDEAKGVKVDSIEQF